MNVERKLIDLSAFTDRDTISNASRASASRSRFSIKAIAGIVAGICLVGGANASEPEEQGHSHLSHSHADMYHDHSYDDGNSATSLLTLAAYQQSDRRSRSNRSSRRSSNRSGNRSSNRGNNRQRSDRSSRQRSGDRSRSSRQRSGDNNRSDRSRSDRSRSDRSRSDRSRSDRSRRDQTSDQRGNARDRSSAQPRGSDQTRSARQDQQRFDAPRNARRDADSRRGSSRATDRRSDGRSARGSNRRSDRHFRSGYSRSGYRRYSGKRFAHGYRSRRGHGYFCIEHALFHYFTGFDPYGFSRVSYYGRRNFAYPNACYPVERVGPYRGRRALIRAIQCVDDYGYAYLYRNSQFVVRYFY